MKLSEIVFPVYHLGKNKPVTQGTKVLLQSTRLIVNNETGEAEEDTLTQLIDDTSVPGVTLGNRRIQLLNNGIPLYKIKKSIYYLGDLIKLATKGTYFIDNLGKVFNYTKVGKYKLTCHKIISASPLQGIGAIITIEGSVLRHKVLFYNESEHNYAGILHSSIGHIMYGLYRDKFKDTVRSV